MVTNAATIEDLYRQCPSLARVESSHRHTRSQQTAALRYMEPGTVGAELGVFTGLFSAQILEHAQPAILHLVDPWWNAFGEFYPDWGEYTDFGRLPTAVAHQAVKIRVCEFAERTAVRIHPEKSTDWLKTLPEASLDWAYLDSTHKYDYTLAELELLSSRVKPDGIIIGDDWHPRREHPHHGVFRAVNMFIKASDFEIVCAGVGYQWAIRRSRPQG